MTRLTMSSGSPAPKTLLFAQPRDDSRLWISFLTKAMKAPSPSSGSRLARVRCVTMMRMSWAERSSMRRSILRDEVLVSGV
jgi:hypothetical protein